MVGCYCSVVSFCAAFEGERGSSVGTIAGGVTGALIGVILIILIIIILIVVITMKAKSGSKDSIGM